MIFSIYKHALGIIPSLELGLEGPTLKTVFVITEDYISEIDVASPEFQFDAAFVNSIFNIRIQLGDVEVVINAKEIEAAKSAALTPPKAKVKKYKTVKVILFHHGALRSNITYVGADHIKWLDHVISLIPFARLKRTAHGLKNSAEGVEELE